MLIYPPGYTISLYVLILWSQKIWLYRVQRQCKWCLVPDMINLCPLQ